MIDEIQLNGNNYELKESYNVFEVHLAATTIDVQHVEVPITEDWITDAFDAIFRGEKVVIKVYTDFEQSTDTTISSSNNCIIFDTWRFGTYQNVEPENSTSNRENDFYTKRYYAYGEINESDISSWDNYLNIFSQFRTLNFSKLEGEDVTLVLTSNINTSNMEIPAYTAGANITIEDNVISANMPRTNNLKSLIESNKLKIDTVMNGTTNALQTVPGGTRYMLYKLPKTPSDREFVGGVGFKAQSGAYPYVLEVRTLTTALAESNQVYTVAFYCTPGFKVYFKADLTVESVNGSEAYLDYIYLKELDSNTIGVYIDLKAYEDLNGGVVGAQNIPLDLTESHNCFATGSYMGDNPENPLNRVYTLDEIDSLALYPGYDETKTQVLKNVQGTLTWIDE